MKNSILIALLAALVFCSSCAPKTGSRWVVIGEKVVDFRADHDILKIGPDRGKFTGLKFRVKRAPIHVLNIKVNYGNGNSDQFVIGKRVPAGTESRVFGLPGDARVLRNIRFNYKTGGRSNVKAVVQVLGRR